MRVGSFVYATDQGLGILAKDFYDEGVITDVIVVRHGKRKEHDEWYPDSPRIENVKADAQLYNFVRSVDVMLFFETPFNWNLIEYCRGAGTKTALMVMYECMPKEVPYQPDLILCPSLLDLQYYPEGEFIPVPVPRSIKWRQRTRAEVFVHNAGHGGLKGRNGTKELCEALQHVKSDARFIIRSQMNEAKIIHPRIRYEGYVSYNSLFQEGDVFVFPEKFNGLSLPLQEARAAGMLVMGTDRFPMNTWLPREPLVPVESYRKNRVGGCNEFDEAVVDPRAIAAKIDEWYGRDIANYSLSGKAWAEDNSWDVLRPKYLQLLEELCKLN